MKNLTELADCSVSAAWEGRDRTSGWDGKGHSGIRQARVRKGRAESREREERKGEENIWEGKDKAGKRKKKYIFMAEVAQHSPGMRTKYSSIKLE